MGSVTEKKQKRDRRHARIRARVIGTGARPRLAVFRSNRAIYAQLIDDERGVTLAAADSRESKAGTARECAAEVGSLIAKRAKEQKVTAAVFDRGGFRYQGAIAAVADGAREGGLDF